MMFAWRSLGSAVFVAPADDTLVALKEQQQALPSFCGGAGNMDSPMLPASADDAPAEQPDQEVQTTLD